MISHSSSCIVLQLTSLPDQLFSEQPPFVGLMDRQVPMRVVRGTRPPRPSSRDGVLMPQALWSITELCWAQELDQRPASQSVVETLRDVIDMASGNVDHILVLLGQALDALEAAQTVRMA